MQHKDYRLAAILYTDIVGFSRMMGEDEAKTLALLEVHNTIIESVVTQNQGTVIKTIGDAYMIDFRSTVFALQSAIEIQEKLYEYNISHDGNKLVIRIGVHLGDIYFYENDAFGEGINIAARLQSFAKPGCICFSQDVFNQVLNKIDFHAEKLGKISLKNIAKEIRGYEIETKNTVFDIDATLHCRKVIAEDDGDTKEATETERKSAGDESTSPQADQNKSQQNDSASSQDAYAHISGEHIKEDFVRATKNIAWFAEKKLSQFLTHINTQFNEDTDLHNSNSPVQEKEFDKCIAKDATSQNSATTQSQSTHISATNNIEGKKSSVQTEQGPFSFEHIREKCCTEYECAYTALSAHLLSFVLVNALLWYINYYYLSFFIFAPLITVSWTIGLMSHLLYVKALKKRKKDIERIYPLSNEAWRAYRRLFRVRKSFSQNTGSLWTVSLLCAVLGSVASPFLMTFFQNENLSRFAGFFPYGIFFAFFIPPFIHAISWIIHALTYGFQVQRIKRDICMLMDVDGWGFLFSSKMRNIDRST